MSIIARAVNYWNRISTSASALVFGIRLMFRVCTSDHLFFALYEGPYFALGTRKHLSRATPVYICRDEEMLDFVDLFYGLSFDLLNRLEVDGLDDRAIGMTDKILQYFVLNRRTILDNLTIGHCGCSNESNELVSTHVLSQAFSRINELTVDLRRRNHYNGPDLRFQQQCLTAINSATNLVKLTLKYISGINSRSIADILVSNATLAEFSFHGSFTDDNYLTTIMPILRDHKTLHTLDYSDKHIFRYPSPATRSTLKILWGNHVLKKINLNRHTRDTNPTIACLEDRNIFQCSRILRNVSAESLWPMILHKAGELNTSLLFLLVKEKPELFNECRKRRGGMLVNEERSTKRPRLTVGLSTPSPVYNKWRRLFQGAATGTNFS